MTPIRSRIAAAVLAAAVPAFVAGCFGGGSSESPEDVLKQTFNNPTSVSSGVLDVSLGVSAQGKQGGNLQAKLSGPFQGNPDDPTQFPQLDLSATASGGGAGQNIDFRGGVTATSDQAFLTYQNQAYEVPKQVYDSFKRSYQQQAQAGQATQNGSSASSVLGQLGVDPSTWLTNVSSEGDVDVEGTQTVHIHGDANVSQILSDLGKIAQSAPGASSQGFDPSQLGLLSSAVQNATVDVYSGEDDHILRKLELKLTIAPPGGLGGVTSANIDLSITLSGVNEQQTISAPANAKPLNDLLDQLGVQLPSVGSLGTPGNLPGASGGGAQKYQKYLQCVQAAGTADEINACAQKYL